MDFENDMSSIHLVVLPGGGYEVHAEHEAEPVAAWLRDIGMSAAVFRYSLHTPLPGPLDDVRAEIRHRRLEGADTVGAIGFSAGGHLAGLAALSEDSDPSGKAD